MIKHYSFICIFICYCLTTSSSVLAQSTGEALTKKHCADCHGDTGNGNHLHNDNHKIPRIAGFSSFLIYDTLSQFKTASRQGMLIKNTQGQNTDMNQISNKLSDEMAESIALYISKQTFVPAYKSDNFDNNELVFKGKQLHYDLCNDCHGEGGTSVVDDAPILKGQVLQYLQHQFKEISSFKRYMPKRMERKFRKLNDNDKSALLAFYSDSRT